VLGHGSGATVGSWVGWLKCKLKNCNSACKVPAKVRVWVLGPSTVCVRETIHVGRRSGGPSAIRLRIDVALFTVNDNCVGRRLAAQRRCATSDIGILMPQRLSRRKRLTRGPGALLGGNRNAFILSTDPKVSTEPVRHDDAQRRTLDHHISRFTTSETVALLVRFGITPKH
jgi:hypothetical protein